MKIRMRSAWLRAAGATAAIVSLAAGVALMPQAASAAPGRPSLAGIDFRNAMDLAQVNRLVTTPGGLAQLKTRVGPNGTTCSEYPVYISSYANDKYVSVELGFTGQRHAILRARSDGRGPWEMFEECWYVNTSGKYVYTLRSMANWKYVSVEYDFAYPLTNVLRARADAPDVWERFYMGVPQNWHMNLQSVWISYYVSVEMAYGGNDWAMLRARSKSFGPWEDLGQS